MNIVLLNHYAGSPRHGMEFRPYYLAREWVRAGHRVTVLAASYSHLRTQQPDMHQQAVVDEAIDGIEYRWYRTPPYQGNGPARVRNMLAFLAATRRDARYIARSRRPDVVIASSTYPMDIWPARRMARLAEAKLVFEVHDLWPLTPIELGTMPRWHPFILWVGWAEGYAYRHADGVVSLLPKTRDYMMSRGLDPDRWHYVPNGVDQGEWHQPVPLPEAIASELHRIRERGLPVVGYAGNHGLANALDSLLDAAKLMQVEAEFVMAGPGPERERLQRRIRDEHIQNVTMLPAVSRAAVPALLRELDIEFIGFKSQPLYRFGIAPNKLLDYMMAGKPIVMAVDAGNDPVTEGRCGRTVPPEDPVAIRRAIVELAGLPPAERAAMGARGRAYVVRNHGFPALARKFVAAIDHEPGSGLNPRDA